MSKPAFTWCEDDTHEKLSATCRRVVDICLAANTLPPMASTSVPCSLICAYGLVLPGVPASRLRPYWTRRSLKARAESVDISEADPFVMVTSLVSAASRDCCVPSR